MTKAVQDLLNKANELDQKVDNPELKECIEALEYLGDDAKGTSQEYKDLKEIVEKIEAELDGDEEQEQKPYTAGDTQGDEGDTQGGDGDEEEKTEEKPKPKRKLKYVGIKQIGSMWYSIKDNYKTGFATADECAEHFNKD